MGLGVGVGVAVGVGVGVGLGVGAAVGVAVGMVVGAGVAVGRVSKIGVCGGTNVAAETNVTVEMSVVLETNVTVGMRVELETDVAVVTEPLVGMGDGLIEVAVGVGSGVGVSILTLQAHTRVETSRIAAPLHIILHPSPALPLSIISSFRQQLAWLRVYPVLAANPHLPNPPPTPASHLLGCRHSHQVQAPSEDGPRGGD